MDPLADRGKVSEWKNRVGSGTIPKDPAERQNLIMNMMMHPNDFPPLRQTDMQRAEEQDMARYVHQMKQEKLAAEKAREQTQDSDSDSCTEQMRTQERKKVAKKQVRDAKNMRRKQERSGIPEIPDLSERKVPDPIMFVRPMDGSVSAAAVKRMDDDEAQYGQNPRDGLLTTHPTLSRKEMSKLSGKGLQQQDTMNPLPLQRTYYLKRKHRAVDQDDKEEFESEVHNVQFTPQDLSTVVDMMRQGVRSWIPRTRPEFLEAMISSMEMCTREVEEAFLRTPVEGERRCIADEGCEGMKIEHAKPCILVEKLTRLEREEQAKTGKLPSMRKLCVMCQRYVVGYYYINTKAECDTIRTKAVLSQYYNLADKCGEYLLEDCIMSSSRDYQGLPGPVVFQVRNKYKQEVQNGVTYFLQVGYKKPEQLVTETARSLLFQ